MEPTPEQPQQEPLVPIDERLILSASGNHQIPAPQPTLPIAEPPSQFNFGASAYAGATTPYEPAPKKRNKKVEAFFADIQDQEINKIQTEKEKLSQENELNEKLKLLTQVEMYLKFFPWLKDRVPLRKKKFTEDDPLDVLQNAVSLLQKGLDMHQAEETAGNYFGYMLKGIEMITERFNPLNLRLNNLSSRAEMFLPLVDQELKEIVIKYPSLFKQPTEMRFLMKVFKILYMMDYANKTGAFNINPQDIQGQVSNVVADKYKDL